MLFSGKIIDNHSSINMDFTWLERGQGLKGFEEKGYTGSKIVYWLSSFFITKTIN